MHQNYQLSYFEKLVRIDLKKESQNHKQPDAKYLSVTVNEALQQKEDLIQNFGRYLCHLGKKKQADWYVQTHQHQLVQLIDQTIEYLDTDDILNRSDFLPENSWQYLYRFLYRTLTEILSFIESEFPRYLDIDCKIPDAYLYQAQENFSTTLQILSAKSEEGKVDASLFAVLLQPFEEFLDIGHPGQFVSYTHLHYLTKLSKRIRKILDSNRCGLAISEGIEDELHFLNFNSIAYLQFWTDRASKELEQLPTSRDRLNRLIFLQKKISQTRTKPGLSLNKLHGSLQNQLSCWLSAEIIYHKEREIISLSGPSTGELDRWKDFKVQTCFSVPQMGAILKLLFDGGYYLNKNKTELLDFFSYFFASVKQDAVSGQSLRGHFYKESATVSKSVREIFGDLINLSHKGINVLFCFACNCYVLHDLLFPSEILDIFQ